MNKEEKHSNKCPICGRPIHKKSQYCIFHAGVEEKNEEEFKRELKEYIQEIKEEDKEYDFNLFIFVGEINFSKDLNITIFTNANFGGATFEDNTNFERTTFEGIANFGNATFEGDDIFGGTTVSLSGCWAKTFKENTKLVRTTFKKKACFRGTTFKRDAWFVGTLFKGDADFIRAIIEENANFVEANFEGNTSFDQATFKVDSNFSGTTFKGDISFSYTTLVPATMLEIKLAKKGIIKFEYTNLENVILDLDLDEGVLVDFSDSLLRNTKIKKTQIENHILQEKEKEFSKAEEIYLLLKNNFHSIGRYGDESWAFTKEKDMERKNNCHFKSLHKWLWSCFLNAIYGYGEKPERVFLSAILIILIFACVFMNYGITSDSQIINLPKYNIIKELFKGIIYGNLLIIFKGIPWDQIRNCLYFSTVTFTTLGLGDFTPVESWGRIFVGLEAFIGAFMMALFVYTFARRTGGR